MAHALSQYRAGTYRYPCVSVADALTAWSDWAVEPYLTSKPIFACNLQSGSSHSVVKVCAQLPQDAREFVIRFSEADAESLAPDIALELRLLTLASAHGLAPKVLWRSADNKTLVMEYIAPHSAPHSEPVTTESLSALIKGIHQLSVCDAKIDLTRQLQHYTDIARLRGINDEQLIDPSLPILKSALAALASDRDVLCHNDLHPGNVLQSGNGLVAIDWEYAGMGSAYFDLAVALQSWPSVDRHELLEHVIGAGYSRELMNSAQCVYAAIEWNWYCASGTPAPEKLSRPRVLNMLAEL